MTGTAPETSRVTTARIVCDGATDIAGGAALGHPRSWLQIDEKGYVDCGYCDRRFVLIGGPADTGAGEAAPGGTINTRETHAGDVQGG